MTVLLGAFDRWVSVNLLWIKCDVLVHTNFDKNELIICFVYLYRSSSFTLHTDFNNINNLISFKTFWVYHFFNWFNRKIRMCSLPIYILDRTALLCVGRKKNTTNENFEFTLSANKQVYVAFFTLLFRFAFPLSPLGAYTCRPSSRNIFQTWHHYRTSPFWTAYFCEHWILQPDVSISISINEYSDVCHLDCVKSINKIISPTWFWLNIWLMQVIDFGAEVCLFECGKINDEYTRTNSSSKFSMNEWMP